MLEVNHVRISIIEHREPYLIIYLVYTHLTLSFIVIGNSVNLNCGFLYIVFSRPVALLGGGSRWVGVGRISGEKAKVCLLRTSDEGTNMCHVTTWEKGEEN